MQQKDCYSLCYSRGLLNPLYNYFPRIGCVRCPKQRLQSLLLIKLLEPEKYEWCLRNDNLSPVKFKPNMTFNQCDLKIRKMREQMTIDDFLGEGSTLTTHP